MSHSRQSSAGEGCSSSPCTGTDPTLYSPDLVRTGPPGQVKHHPTLSQATTVKALGKQPVRQPVKDDHVAALGVLPVPARATGEDYLNELSETHCGFVSRYLFIDQLPDGTCAGTDKHAEMGAVTNLMKLYQCFANAAIVRPDNHGVHMRFDNVRDAAEAKDIFQQHEFLVCHITSYDYAIAKTQDTGAVDEFEGQIKVPVLIQPNPEHAVWDFTSKDMQELTDTILRAGLLFGEVRYHTHVQTDDTNMVMTFRMEFFSVDAAHRAVYSLQRDTLWGLSEPDAKFQWVVCEPSAWSGERALNSPHRTKPRIDDKGRIVGYRPLQSILTTRDNDIQYPAEYSNRVFRARILNGTDVRTTIMLRNIPSKLDWMDLKAILDKACFGTYDFVYLRIDFSTAGTVGYAFVNFTDVNGMIAVLDHIEGKQWHGFHSGKTAQVSYATIQGKEALTGKFRNSSVMLEPPYCRPRLYLPYADAAATNNLRLSGTEQTFPRPNNVAKLTRSVDTARAQGLYPANSNNTAITNRSGAYDRGTPRGVAQASSSAASSPVTPVTPVLPSDADKRNVEISYTYTTGLYTPFDAIPVGFVVSYFQACSPVSTTASVNSNPGVIGAPGPSAATHHGHFVAPRAYPRNTRTGYNYGY